MSHVDLVNMKPHLADGYVVKGLIGTNTLVGIIGPTGSGKTFFAADLALHIAAGRPWRGNHRVRGGLVVYAALEGPVSAENRFVAGRGALSLKASVPLRLTAGPINLRDPGDVARLISFVREAQSHFGVRCAAVFVDTLARALAGADENSGEDMGALIAGADAVRLATGATVTLVHHLGKDPARGARGHSSLRAALDTEITVETQVGSDVRIATVTKQRDLPCGTRHAFKLKPVDLGQDSDGEAVTTCVVEWIDEPPPAARRAPKGKNQNTLLNALLEWRRQHPDAAVISTIEYRALAKAQGLRDRRRILEATDSLQQFGWLRPCVGGFKFLDREEPA